tara:strand:- start:565 stop:804 length:240 start_codon:yes stop_codon:yes gene_type:complete
MLARSAQLTFVDYPFAPVKTGREINAMTPNQLTGFRRGHQSRKTKLAIDFAATPRPGFRVFLLRYCHMDLFPSYQLTSA